MYGNGATIGTMVIIIVLALKIIHKGPQAAVPVFCAAALGTPSLTSAVLPTATVTSPVTRAAAPDFVLPVSTIVALCSFTL